MRKVRGTPGSAGLGQWWGGVGGDFWNVSAQRLGLKVWSSAAGLEIWNKPAPRHQGCTAASRIAQQYDEERMWEIFSGGSSGVAVRAGGGTGEAHCG